MRVFLVPVVEKGAGFLLPADNVFLESKKVKEIRKGMIKCQDYKWQD
jgi:hypothetical protein